MSLTGGRTQQLVLIIVCAIPILGAVVVSPGLFIIDELIYLISVEAMATNQSFIFDNGFSQFASKNLKLWFLVEGPNGLTPQYPPGVALLGAPFYLLLGARGLILLNAVAAAGVAVLTWKLARKLYDSDAVASVAVLILTFCTFHLEYAWGIWPHMTSAFCVLLAFFLALHAIENENGKAVFLNAVGSGLAVGAGMLLRTDSVLILPIIGICIILSAYRPMLAILGGAVGLLPGVMTGVLINMYKFGTPNVLSYGRTGTGGDTDITSHLGVILCLGVAMAALFAIRSLEWTRRKAGFAALVVLVGFAILLVLPQTREALVSLWRGFVALFVDSRTIDDARRDVVLQPDGSLIFWGIAKKALFQSLPWLSVLVLLVLLPWRRTRIRPNSMLLLFVVVWSLPFVALSWHGGLGSNMRYFIPMVPALVILCSTLVVDLASRSGKSVPLVATGILAGLSLGFLLYDRGDAGTDGFTQQAVTLYIFFAVLLIVGSTAFVMRKTALASAPALLAVGFSLGTGLFASVLVDVSYAQQIRAQTETSSRVTEAVEGPVLIYGAPKFFAFGASRPDVLLAMGEFRTEEIDFDLFVDAIGSGYRALALINTAEQVAEATDLSYVALDISPSRRWVELVAGTPQAE